MKEAIFNNLRKFICSRPGFDPRDYIFGQHDAEGLKAYRADVRAAGRDRRHALAMLEYAENWCTPRQMMDASESAFGGRLEIKADGSIQYTAGQFYNMEYRRAACWILAHALTADGRAEGLDCAAMHARAVRSFGRTVANTYFKG